MHSFAEHPKVVGQHEVVNYQVEGNASDLEEGNVGQWGNVRGGGGHLDWSYGMYGH